MPIIIGKLQHIAGADEHSSWSYEIHSNDPLVVTMPELEFGYFNPDTGRVERASCEKSPVLSRTAEYHAPAPTPPPTRSLPPKIASRVRYVGFGFVALGLAMVFTAMRR
jgi:hypothetical protein